MKKLFVLLLCLAAVWSCNMTGSYYVENCQDFVTLSDGSLVNDYSVIYNVSSVASDKVIVPSVDGRRYFLQFDIINGNYDILLKNTLDVSTLQAFPAGGLEPVAHDPVSRFLALRGGGFNSKSIELDWLVPVHTHLSQYISDAERFDKAGLLLYNDEEQNYAAMRSYGSCSERRSQSRKAVHKRCFYGAVKWRRHCL